MRVCVAGEGLGASVGVGASCDWLNAAQLFVATFVAAKVWERLLLSARLLSKAKF